MTDETEAEMRGRQIREQITVVDMDRSKVENVPSGLPKEERLLRISEIRRAFMDSVNEMARRHRVELGFPVSNAKKDMLNE